MGQSTNAILFYGFCWNEEARNPWEIDVDDVDAGEDNDEDEWETRYARTKGCLPPSTPFPDRFAADGYSTPTDYSAAEKTIINQHRAYWKEKRKIIEAASCCIDTHCSGDCPMPYVAVRMSVTTSRRGYPTEITSLAIDPTWDTALAEFCTTLGIKTDGKKAGWWLVSDWN